MSSDCFFTKENLDHCLRTLAKEFRKRNGKSTPAEIILTGGAAILANYGFRDMTYDIDAIIKASSAMQEAINYVGDTMGLPHGWLNSDFVHTRSFSPELIRYSFYYKTFSNILIVRTISREYLVAMKLMSGRQYKHDISDIIGILYEQQQREMPLSYEQIHTAVCNLYGGWEAIPELSRTLIQKILESDNLKSLYQLYRQEELASKKMLVTFEKNYPKTVTEDNIQNILKNLKNREMRHQ